MEIVEMALSFGGGLLIGVVVSMLYHPQAVSQKVRQEMIGE